MPNNEADSVIEPHCTKIGKRKGGSYFSIVCMLFIIILALCINNLMIFKSYKDIEKNFDYAYHELRNSKVSNSDATDENEKLRNENKILKDNYNTVIAQNREIIKQIDDIKIQNDNLDKANKELTDDNIELQNSLKKAASVGIKPQNFTSFQGITSRSEVEKGKYLGKFLGTAYTPSNDECGNSKGITNSGYPIIPGISVAIDNNYWPFGTVFYIKGLGYAVAMDTGGSIKGKNRFDFAVFDKNFAKTLGTKYWEVFLVKLGNGDVDKIKF